MRSRCNSSFIPSLPHTSWDNQQQTSILPIASIVEPKNRKSVDRTSCSWTEDAAPWNKPEPSLNAVIVLPFTHKTAITVVWELVNSHTKAPEHLTIMAAPETSLPSLSEITILFLPFSLGHSHYHTCCSWITGHSNSQPCPAEFCDTEFIPALKKATQQEIGGRNL